MRGVYSIGGFASRVVDTRSGQVVAAPTLSQYVTYAQTPAFAPDGSRLAFVNGDRLDQRVLSVLDVDLAATPPLFSNPRDLVTQNGAALAWPTMLPDASAVVYHEGDSFDSNLFVANNAPSPPQHAEVRLVDVESKAVKALDALNGKTPAGDVYLPYGASVEGRMNYEPSVLPVAVGGYYWVLSRRAGPTATPSRPAAACPAATTPGATRATEPAEEDLDRGARHRSSERRGPEPPRVLRAGAGARGRQHARLRRARTLQGQRCRV
jgi:hypothetical protein